MLTIKHIGLTIKQTETPELEGLEYGGSYDFKCNMCGKELLKVIVTRPNFTFSDGTKFASNYRCVCPYCNSFSDEQYIEGGTAHIFPADSLGNSLTFLENFDINNEGTTILRLKKTRYAKD